MRRALVTGCGGFVGPYVVDALVRAGYRVWGADVKERVGTAALERYTPSDLSDKRSVDELLSESSPDAVVHLAAQSSAGASFDEPFVTLTRNILPILNVLESVRSRGARVRILAVGSGDVYGPVDVSDLPLSETRAPNPASPYALSKAVQEQCCVQYASLYGTDVIVTRSFNHAGAGQRDTFVLSSFARQVAEIRLGAREPVIDTGNLDLRRDFTDVRDVAQAYVSLLENGKRGEVYNVCSGTSHSLRELLDELCALAGVSAKTRLDSKRVRPADAKDLRGDPSKMVRDARWAPRIPIAETLGSLLEFWTRAAEGFTHRGV